MFVSVNVYVLSAQFSLHIKRRSRYPNVRLNYSDIGVLSLVRSVLLQQPNSNGCVIPNKQTAKADNDCHRVLTHP